jgi:type III restriction enzyme
VAWLDRSIRHPDVPQREAFVFLRNLVRHLTEDEGFALPELVRDKYRLKRAVEARIDAHRDAQRREAYQALLHDDGPLTVTPDVCFRFPPDAYPCPSYYAGPYAFTKHYYPTIGTFDSTEEAQCGQLIDRLPEVDCWVRNLARRPRHAFWLQTSTDRFYPDFVCKLRDERYLVVEHKGADRYSTDDATEKRDLGEIWETASGGQCLFVMTKGASYEDAIRAELAA